MNPAELTSIFRPRLTTYEAELRAERRRRARGVVFVALLMLGNVTLAVKLIAARHALYKAQAAACEASR